MEEKNKGMVVLPYVSWVSEKLTRIFKKRKISSAMKPHTKLKALLVHSKDKTDLKEGVYTIDCTGCKKKYVGQTKRKLQVRVKEHRTETEKVSKGTSYTREKKKTITNGDVGVSHTELGPSTFKVLEYEYWVLQKYSSTSTSTLALFTKVLEYEYRVLKMYSWIL